MSKRNPSTLRSQSNPINDLLEHRAFPAVADALRVRIKPILKEWKKLIRRLVPAAAKLDPSALEDSLPDILAKMADALASNDPEQTRAMMERSPLQGIGRFQQHYDVRELVVEDGLLRRLVVEYIAEELGRPLVTEEQVALNMAIDGMQQQVVVAFVTYQNEKLREAAEAELKYLSFLSHDLSGNLTGVTLWLQILKRELVQAGGFDDMIETLDTTQQTILDTVGGMGRLLEAERLRHKVTADKPQAGPTNLGELASRIVRQAAVDTERKGVSVKVEVPADAEVDADAELVALVIQNLISNAVKYSTAGGMVRVSAKKCTANGTNGTKGKKSSSARWAISIADQGPGIAAEHLEHIFEAFRRGETHGRAGVGLGLTIAARAAKLIGAELTVQSKVRKGSIFTVAFPPNGASRKGMQ